MLRLTQKASKDAVEKQVWSITNADTVDELMTLIDTDTVEESFWTGFKLVMRGKNGFDEKLDNAGVKYTKSVEAVTKGKESDVEVIARALGKPVNAITPELIEQFKALI